MQPTISPSTEELSIGVMLDQIETGMEDCNPSPQVDVRVDDAPIVNFVSGTNGEDHGDLGVSVWVTNLTKTTRGTTTVD